MDKKAVINSRILRFPKITEQTIFLVQPKINLQSFTYIHTYIHTDRQTDRQTDIHTYIQPLFIHDNISKLTSLWGRVLEDILKRYI